MSHNELVAGAVIRSLKTRGLGLDGIPAAKFRYSLESWEFRAANGRQQSIKLP
jgi:hypothetical protein